MCQASFRRGEGEKGGCGRSSRGRSDGERKYKEEDGEDEKGRVKVGRHGGEEGRGV